MIVRPWAFGFGILLLGFGGSYIAHGTMLDGTGFMFTVLWAVVPVYIGLRLIRLSIEEEAN